jgi:hypothetical protein
MAADTAPELTDLRGVMPTGSSSQLAGIECVPEPIVL